MPDAISVRASARLRNPRHSAAPTTMASNVEADGAHQVAEVIGLRRLDQAWAKRGDQLENDLLRVDALQPVPDELRIEADLQELARAGGGGRPAGSPPAAS